MKRSLILLLLLTMLTMLTTAASSQTTYYHDVAQAGSGIPFATILVCDGAATPGPPCNPKVNIFNDQALTSAKQNPFQADAQGNFDFYSAQTTPVMVQITAPGVITKTYTISMPLVGSVSAGGLGSGSQHFTDLTLDNFLNIGGSSNNIMSSDMSGDGPIVGQNNGTTFGQTLNNAKLQGGASVVGGDLGLAGTLIPVGSSNTDFNGTLVCSGGTASYTFQNTAYSAPPSCFVNDITNVPATIPTFTVSSSTLSISSCSTHTIQYLCIGRNTGIPATTLASETSNNTTACDPTNPQSHGWCTGTFPSDPVTFPLGLKTQSANTTAQTQVVDPLPGHISDVPITSLLYTGASTQPICHWQPWWNMTPPSYNSHIHIGYSQGNANTIQAQVTEMLLVGCRIVNPDWYGTDTSKATSQNNTIALVTELNNRPNYPLKLMIGIDKGALSPFCPMSTTVDNTTCLTSAFNTQLDFIYNNWSQKPYYQIDPGTSKALVSTFIDETAWSASNWTTIMNNVCSHITTSLGGSIKLLKEYGNFSEVCYSGAYAWPKPLTFSTSNQLCWDTATICGAASFYDGFNTNAHANPTKIPVAYLFKGFDDSNASWGTNRVLAQQCYQLMLNTAAKINGSWSTSTQLPYVMIATWNDYEEGSEVETGIDNCYRPSLALASDTITWSLNPTDVTYATTSSIQDFTIYYGDTSGGPLFLAKKNISNSATSQNISTLVPTGTWLVYVEMRAKPLGISRVTNAVTYTH